MRKFSIGLSLSEMTYEEYIKIIDKYHNFISYIYYSPPLEDFSSRDSLMDAYEKKETISEELKILNYARSKGIKLELAINFEDELDSEYLKAVLKISKKSIEPDSIVTYNHYISDCIEIFGEDKYYVLTYNHSFLSKLEIKEIDKRFNCIVIGNRWIRNKEFYDECKKQGFETKLLLNNGCSHNCSYCITPKKYREKNIEWDCEDILNKNIEIFGMEQTIAVQTIFPFELDLLFKHDDYKISNRPSSYNELKCTLDLYLNKINILDSNKHKLIFDSMTRLYHFQEHYNEKINFKNVITKKKELFYN